VKIEKKAKLIIFQIDLSGEEIGDLINVLYAYGAKNVNATPSITKKERPGYLIFVDSSDHMNMDLFSRYLEQCEIYGHVCQTIHSYFITTTKDAKISFKFGKKNGK
jgi:uncharacterized protein (DUF111 family)